MVKPTYFTIIVSLFFVLLSVPKFGTSQSVNVDSLWQVWQNKTKHDTVRLFAINEISTSFLFSQPDSSLYYGKIQKQFAIEKNQWFYVAKALNTIGKAHYLLNQYNKAIECFEEITKINERLGENKSNIAVLSNLGVVYVNMGEYSKGLNSYFQALEVNKKYGDDEYQSAILGNIGDVYQKMSKHSLAINYLIKALKINESIDNKDGQTINLGNIGLVYLNLEDYDKAIEYFNKAVSLSISTNNQHHHHIYLANLGICYFDQQEYAEALLNYEEALKISKEFGSKNGEAVNLCNIANVYIERGNSEKALELYQKALKIHQEIGSKEGEAINLGNIGKTHVDLNNYSLGEQFLKKAESLNRDLNALTYLENNLTHLSTLYEKTNRPKLALKYYKEYVTLRDSIQSEENYKATIQQEMQYEYDKQTAIDSIANAKEIDIREAEIAQQKAEVKAKRNQQYALYGGVGLLLIFGGFMFNRYRITKKQKGIIEKQKAEVDIQKTEAEKQRDLAQKEHAEAERQKHIVEEKNQEILDSIQYAKRLQDAILPPQKIVKKYLKQSFILFQPKDIVSGDFYWLEVKDEFTMLAVADCTGHGVPGAMVSVICANALNKAVNELGLVKPNEILSKARELVIETFSKTGNQNQIKDGMDISLCVLNEKQGLLHWSGANNPLWILRNENNQIDEIKADKQPVGYDDRLLPFTNHTIKLNKNDCIFLFSDGYSDQFGGEKGKKFKSMQFKKLLMENFELSMENMKVLLTEAFNNWKGEIEQIDDVCVIGVKF